ncbi:unnamed protein product [Agarophyton chilense]
MEIPAHLVAQFCGVTNADASLASQLLHDNGLDMDAAISSFFAIQEAGGLPPHTQSPEESSPQPSTPPRPPTPPPPPVRSPVPQVVDRLLPAVPPPPRNPHIPDPFASSEGTFRSDRLSELFRPPTNIIFSGAFEEALHQANTRKLWLLVNIQRSDVFACHTMNRDVWSDPALQQLISSHFLFVQRDERTMDGNQYKRFYPYHELPHVSVVDPRSGERVRVWGGDGEPISKQQLLSDLVDFVGRNSLEDDSAVRGAPSRRPSTTRSSMEGLVRASSSDAPTRREGGNVEEDMMAAAIAASMEDHPQVNGSSEANGHVTQDAERHASRLLSATNPALNRNRSLRAQQDSAFEESLALDRAREQSQLSEALRKQKEEREEALRLEKMEERREQKRKRIPEAPAESVKEGVHEILFRLPDGKRLQRRFYETDTIGDLYDYVEVEAEGLVEGSFEIVQPFPKVTFENMQARLEDLPRRAALIVGLKQ